MKPAQLGNFLAQLPADMVDKVEVIPNPSARDDPEGVAGIINIVLRKEADAGRSGGFTLAGGTTGRAEIGGNLGYQRGPLTLFGSYGFLRDNRPRRDSIYRENLYLEPMTFLSERGRRSQIPLAHTLTGSAGYKLSAHDELSADVMYSTRSEAESNDDRLSQPRRVARSHGHRRSREQRHQPRVQLRVHARLQARLHREASRALGRAARLPRARGRAVRLHDSHARARRNAGVGLRPGVAARLRAPERDHAQGGLPVADHRARCASRPATRDRCQQFHTTLDTQVLDTATQRARAGHEPHQQLHVRPGRQRRLRDAQRAGREVLAAGRAARRARDDAVPSATRAARSTTTATTACSRARSSPTTSTTRAR